MECKVCSNQDMKIETRTPKTGRNAGNPCRVYSCTTPGCVNDKGYPNAIWVPIKAPKVPASLLTDPPRSMDKTPSSTLEKKVDQILAILVKNFGNVTLAKDESVEEEQNPF